MRRIDLIFFDAGGGHRSAANALRLVIANQRRPWEVRLVNLQELLDPLDVFRKATGLRMQDVYNLMLRRGWTLGTPLLTRWMQALIRALHAAQVGILEDHWRWRQPELVVSLVPHFNRALREGLRRAMPGSPFLTILTDLADYPPHFWIEQQEQFLICGTQRAVAQARTMGHPAERVFRTSGMILHPRFYETISADRAVERQRLGLHPDLPTGLIMFGGQGSPAIAAIAKHLDNRGRSLQLIVICGRNQKLASQVRQYKSHVPMHVEEFTADVPYYMHLSDFFIGKPGPGSLSEALAMKLPVIVERNAWTLPQERYNADWILEKQVGVVVTSFRNIGKAVETMLLPQNFCRYQRNAAIQSSRAVFEIPDILQKLL